MRMNIHDINKIKLGDTEKLPSTKSRSILIQSDEGDIEIVLFNDDAEKLKVFNLFEDKSL